MLRKLWAENIWMQQSLHTTHRTYHSPSRQYSVVSHVGRSPGVPRADFVGVRGQWSHDYALQDYGYSLLPAPFPSQLLSLDGQGNTDSIYTSNNDADDILVPTRAQIGCRHEAK